LSSGLRIKEERKDMMSPIFEKVLKTAVRLTGIEMAALGKGFRPRENGAFLCRDAITARVHDRERGLIVRAGASARPICLDDCFLAIRVSDISFPVRLIKVSEDGIPGFYAVVLPFNVLTASETIELTTSYWC
jgi:hypothetical protein